MKTAAARALHTPAPARRAPAAQDARADSTQAAQSATGIDQQMSNAETRGHRFEQGDVYPRAAVDSGAAGPAVGEPAPIQLKNGKKQRGGPNGPDPAWAQAVSDRMQRTHGGGAAHGSRTEIPAARAAEQAQERVARAQEYAQRHKEDRERREREQQAKRDANKKK